MEELHIMSTSRWFSWNLKSKCLSIFRCITLLTTIIVIIAICIWCFNLTSLNDNSTRLYSRYKNLSSRISGYRSRQFDIVLSYYGENIQFVERYIRYLKNVSSLHKLRLRIIVYNKNSNINNTILRNNLNADIVHLLPNIGREGGTYLYHIIKNYNVLLADHIIFSQAGVEGITDTGLTDWFEDRLENQFNASVGYMPLVHSSMISKDLCGKHGSGNFQRLTDLWGIIQQTLCPINGFSVAFRGQFLVSKQRILRRSLNLYKYLYELITANSTHWIHTDPRCPPEWSSKPEQPSFGYVVERLWTILFNCSNPDLFERCEKKQCACFDYI